MAHVTLKMTSDGTPFTVLKFEYKLKRGAEKNGRPSTPPKEGTITLTVDTPLNTTDNYFAKWLSEHEDKIKSKRKGSIEIRATKKDKKPVRTIKFEDAYIISLEEKYDEYDADYNLIRIVEINAKILIIEGSRFEKEWK